MEVFWAEKMGTVEHSSRKKCLACEGKLTLVRVIIDADTGDVIHLLECPCGERIWTG
jgi:hypothetical protein